MTVVMTAAAVSALLGAAVVGGIFFAFSNFVMSSSTADSLTRAAKHCAMSRQCSTICRWPSRP